MVDMGYSRQDAENSIRERKYDEKFALYLLLNEKSSEVQIIIYMCFILKMCNCKNSLMNVNIIYVMFKIL